MIRHLHMQAPAAYYQDCMKNDPLFGDFFDVVIRKGEGSHNPYIPSPNTRKYAR